MVWHGDYIIAVGTGGIQQGESGPQVAIGPTGQKDRRQKNLVLDLVLTPGFLLPRGGLLPSLCLLLVPFHAILVAMAIRLE